MIRDGIDRMNLITTVPLRLRCWLALALAFVVIGAARGQQRSDSATRWEVLENCELIPDKALDGDNFHVKHKGREYIFRLYFVDAPETDNSLPDRVVDQAAYFGIASNQITVAGKLAEEFTHQKLATGRITVITRWQNAMGRSSLARYYAVVLVGGKNLAEELVDAGLARIYGPRANWPDGPRSVTFVNQLKNLEISARSGQRGIWDTTRFIHKDGSASSKPPTGNPSGQPGTGRATVELNSASVAELDRLPGVGKVIAERIVAYRPFAKVDDLKRVPGIGDKTMDRLRPLVRVDPVSSSDAPNR